MRLLAMFEFLKTAFHQVGSGGHVEDEPIPVDYERIEAVTRDFLAEREIHECQIKAFELDGKNYIHVHTNPNRAIRYSNLIEIQIKSSILQTTGVQVDFVLWRFRLNENHEADVDHIQISEPYQEYLQEGTEMSALPLENKKEAEDAGFHSYSLNQALQGLDIKEISFAEMAVFQQQNAICGSQK